MFNNTMFNRHSDNSISVEVVDALNYIIKTGNFSENTMERVYDAWINEIAVELGDITFAELKKECKTLKLTNWCFSGRWFVLLNEFDINENSNIQDDLETITRTLKMVCDIDGVNKIKELLKFYEISEAIEMAVNMGWADRVKTLIDYYETK